MHEYLIHMPSVDVPLCKQLEISAYGQFPVDSGWQQCHKATALFYSDRVATTLVMYAAQCSPCQLMQLG